MEIISLYNDVLDRTATEQNGSLTISKFNRFSRLGELRLLEYLSGDLEGIRPPEPYSTQKLRDFLTPFIVPDTKQVENGTSPLPDNYYKFENLSMIGDYRDEVCGKDVLISNGNTPIEVLDAQQFDSRCQTFIKRLQPSDKKPIAKMEDGGFQYKPSDLGSVKLEYVRYPIFGQIEMMVDNVYFDEVPNPATSIDYEWGDGCRNLLLFFIVQQYPISTREKALVEQNELVGKSSRG